MADLQNGMLVRHSRLGLGKVVAVEPTAVHVFFPRSDSRFAAKLRLPMSLGLLRTDGLVPDPHLDGLTAFALDSKSGRYAPATSWVSHDEAVAQFFARFPGGFSDPANAARRKGRVARWRTAHDSWVETLGEGEGARLLAAGDLDELVARAVKLDRALAAVHPAFDADAVKDALTAEAPARAFSEALFELLSAPFPTTRRHARSTR